MPRVTQRESARRDLVEHAVHLAENAGLDMAERFLANAEASFNDLAQQPKMGAPLALKHPDLAKVRKWRVKGFVSGLTPATASRVRAWSKLISSSTSNSMNSLSAPN